MDGEDFLRVIAFQHAVGTMERIAIRGDQDKGFALSVSLPDKTTREVSVYLERSVLDPLIDALLDLKEHQEKAAWKRTSTEDALAKLRGSVLRFDNPLDPVGTDD